MLGCEEFLGGAPRAYGFEAKPRRGVEEGLRVLLGDCRALELFARAGRWGGSGFSGTAGAFFASFFPRQLRREGGLLGALVVGNG